MKIQNEYIFRTITSEFIYFQKKKKHGSSMVTRPTMPGSSVATRPRRLGLVWVWHGCQTHVTWVW